MKIQTAYLSYFNLTPNFENEFFHKNHEEIITVLRRHFPEWKKIKDKHGKGFSIGFMVTRKKGTDNLTIKGPSISKKLQIVDYTIFLPDEITDLNHYIDLVFEGIGTVLAKYNIPESEALTMKIECKNEMAL
ncbi:hypothetical protein LAG90_09225 [Marinilongibacter aquaticus]|uniref:hypothetical protein n=1 Tax=Marinilongibacter aquaticus TaxID=2975157 RepID=UPI0021BD352F|nr:hypothetical protein [Marinilongibacter aquaticus]UBM60816.1 hypothetical protein LAG90_09225 [Marinilongibacter aquaticus]